MRLTAWATLALPLLLLVPAGCKKKKSSSPSVATSQAQAAAAALAEREQPAPGPIRPRSERQEMLHHISLAPITVDEVRSLVPHIDGAAPVGQPGQPPGAHQVKAILCVTGKDPATTASEMATWLDKNGFTQVRKRPSPTNPDLVTVGADKQAYHLAASVQRGAYPDCPARANKTKVMLMFLKRGPSGAKPAAAGSGTPPSSPGTPSAAD